MSVEFINIDRETFLSLTLYKYLTLERALEFLETSKIWFASPTTWEDPFEKRFVETMYQTNGIKVPFPWKDRVYCLCLSENANCEAYWNTYSKDDIGICFALDTEKLLDLLDGFAEKNDVSIYIGPVVYQNTTTIKGRLSKNPFIGPSIDLDDPVTDAKMLLLKRNAFEYEEEVRIILVKDTPSPAKGVMVDYSVENTDLIKLVKIDPRVGNYVTKMLKTLFAEKYEFEPMSKRVNKSGIYADQSPSYIKLD